MTLDGQAIHQLLLVFFQSELRDLQTELGLHSLNLAPLWLRLPALEWRRALKEKHCSSFICFPRLIPRLQIHLQRE